MRTGFIGAGRLAHALAPALASAGYEVIGTASRSSGNAQAIADAADLVFLAVPDGAIGEVAAGIRWRAGAAAVHCSGAHGLELLAPAAKIGAHVGVFHPLQTFAGGGAELAGVTVAVQGSPELLQALEDMATALGCRPMRLQAGLEPLYHASAAMAGNYLVALLAEAARLWEPLGCSAEQGLQALLPLARTTLANVQRLGPKAALTGPIARGDAGTVRKHMAALASKAPDAIPAYRELGRQTLRLAVLAPSVSREIDSILQAQKETSPCA